LKEQKTVAMCFIELPPSRDIGSPGRQSTRNSEERW
jgi:hypothetical protein